ncbi:rluC, partial [Symbiodinium sp. CCMP2592]
MSFHRASDILGRLARLHGQVKESLGGRPDHPQSSGTSERFESEDGVPVSSKSEKWKKWIPAARRQPSPSDHRTARKLRPWKKAYDVVEVEDDDEAVWMEDSTEATAEVWDQEFADELEQREEQRQEEIDEVPGEAEDQPWEGEEFQEDERELGEEAVGEDSEPPPEEEEPPLQKASFAPPSRTTTIPPAMPRRAPPTSSPKEPNGSVGALAAFHLFKRRAADAAKK